MCGQSSSFGIFVAIHLFSGNHFKHIPTFKKVQKDVDEIQSLALELCCCAEVRLCKFTT